SKHLAAPDVDRLLKVFEQIAEGKTLIEVLKQPGTPTRTTFYRWVELYPEVKKAYDAARELSAQSFEDEALDLARKLSGENDFTGTKVRALEVAMGQLRWSATRRDPA